MERAQPDLESEHVVSRIVRVDSKVRLPRWASEEMSRIPRLALVLERTQRYIPVTSGVLLLLEWRGH